MAQIPNTKLELHPSMFDLLMTVLAYNAANAPVESVRSGAKDLIGETYALYPALYE